MALALNSFTLTLLCIGNRDAERIKQFEILATGADDATKRSNAQGAVTAFLADLPSVSSAHLQGYKLSENWYEGDPVPGSGLGNVYEEAIITMPLDVGGGKKHSTSIMAPADGIFVGDSGNTQQIDTADSGLAAYLQNFAADGTHFMAVSDGEQYENPLNILSARVRSVRSGKTF